MVAEARAIRHAASPRNDYRRPRRRPAHLRTKSGCLTCRKRKKKCDETRSQCLNCAKQELDCVWQSPDIQRDASSFQQCSSGEGFPMAHSTADRIINQASSAKVSSPRDHSTQWSVATSASFDPEKPGASLLSSDVLDNPLSMAPRARFAISIPQLPAHTHIVCSSAITAESGPLFDFLKSTFLPQLIRPGTNGRISDALSKQTLALALDNPFCMHALLACCGAEIPSAKASFRQLARYHYTHAVAGLRNNLNDGLLQDRWIVAMLTIMMLCIYERSKPSGSSGVEIHLAGAARLIQLFSGSYTVSFQDPGIEQAMQHLVRESFIFHVTTSLPFHDGDVHHGEIEAALALAEEAISQDFGSRYFAHLDSPVLGFPPQLFRCIYTVYRLYRMSDRAQIDPETWQGMDRSLCQWDERIMATMEGPADITSSGPKLYILGCRILLRRMSPSDLPDLSISLLVQEGMEIVGQLQPAQDYYADYYCWPFLVLGMNLGHTPDRDLLMRQVEAFGAATNNGTMRRLADMLRICWEGNGR